MTASLYAGLYTMMAAAASNSAPGIAQPSPIADDPFASEVTLTASELAEQRGGFIFEEDATEAGGFLVHFGVQLTEFTVNTVLSAANTGITETISTQLTLDPTTNDIIIDNTADNIVLQTRLAVDVSISNFSARTSALSTGSTISSFRTQAQILEAFGN